MIRGANMPTTLTLKNIPDEVYERLKASAETHRRSVNSEAIVCLESVLLPDRMAASERLAGPEHYEPPFRKAVSGRETSIR